MLARRIGGLLAALITALAVSPATAQFYSPGYFGPAPAKWFVEGNVGAGWGDFDSVSIPGTGFVSAGSSDVSFAASAGVGFYFTNQIYAKLSYRYFGSFASSGSFVGTPSSIDVDAHGVMLGLGANFDLSNQVFVEAVGEIGTAFLRSSRGQFAGINGGGTETNFAGGLGLGLGYHLTRSTDLLVMGNYHWLGDAKAGFGATTIDAQDLNVVSATIGLRMKF